MINQKNVTLKDAKTIKINGKERIEIEFECDKKHLYKRIIKNELEYKNIMDGLDGINPIFFPFCPICAGIN